MKFLRRLIGLFQDSPTFGRDRANLVSGFTIGTAGLLLNGAILCLVLPLLVDPDNGDFRMLTENLEFGQLLALILLGGATAFAAVLIPLRMVSVFWGPRIGGYFDQIVLSGISPLRFVIGKATSQNLFLGLIVFLLCPYLMLSVTLGGVDVISFLAGLFLVWMFCMAISMVTLWLSLYLNDLLAAIVVIWGTFVVGGLGCIPLPFQPFAVTPMPALMHPVFSAMPFLQGQISPNFWLAFLSCSIGMGTVIGVSLFAIYLGPLYGIVRENSTFGEVVRPGDSKRKRWFRMRLHIQRPSELAFFYENRGDQFRRHEGLIRWAMNFFGLVLLSVTAYASLMYIVSHWVRAGGGRQWWIYEFHLSYPFVHGGGLLLAMLLFSHSRNSMFLRLPTMFGRTSEVARLDSIGFGVFLIFSSIAAVSTVHLFEYYIAQPQGATVFPSKLYGTSGNEVNYQWVASGGTIVLSVSALAFYLVHRFVCLSAWLRSVALFGAAGVYFFFVAIIPVIVGAVIYEFPELQDGIISGIAQRMALVSPFLAMAFVFNELPGSFPRDWGLIPFLVVHAIVIMIALWGIKRQSQAVRDTYLTNTQAEAAS